MSNYKKVEALLYEYKPLKVANENLKLDIENLEIEYRGTGSINYDERTGPTNAFSSVVENEIIKKEAEIDNLKREIRKNEIFIKKIDNAIDSLDTTEQFIIKLRYIERYNNKQIAKKLYLNEYWISHKKKRIIEKLTKLL